MAPECDLRNRTLASSTHLPTSSFPVIYYFLACVPESVESMRQGTRKPKTEKYTSTTLLGWAVMHRILHALFEPQPLSW